MISVRLKRLILSFLLMVVLLLIGTRSAAAQSRAGVRAGISGDPNQFYFGAHVELAEVVKQLWFRPNVEVGAGDGLTLIALNGEFAYFLPTQPGRWNLYFGGGPAAVLRTFRSRPSGRDSDAGPGFNLLMGLERRRGLLAEIKVGALDSPGFKLGIGWTW